MVYFLNRQENGGYEFDESANRFNADIQILISRGLIFTANYLNRETKNYLDFNISNDLKRMCLRKWKSEIDERDTRLKLRINIKLEEL